MHCRSVAFIGGDEPKLSLITSEGHAFVSLTEGQITLLMADMARHKVVNP